MVKKINFENYQYENHWYQKVLNSQMNPLVSHFFNMPTSSIITRYIHLHPKVDREYLESLLTYKPKFFFWSGGDLINVTSSNGKRQMVLIETNSCPSGQKSTPLLNENDELGGYGRLVRGGVKSFLKGKRMIEGKVAVFYDKNEMENTGYAHALSEYFNEDVYLATYFNGEKNDHIKIKDNIFYLKIDGQWEPLRFIFKYVTQKPWNRIPSGIKTQIFNPIITCLAGGRNKAVAAKAYEFFNTELKQQSLEIQTPETFWDIQKDEIPFWYEKFGGHLVVKVPYSNAGQGVYLITNKNELENFMTLEFDYDKFLIQSLIGNYNWSSNTEKGQLYHVGTLPNKHKNIYVADNRIMINYTETGFRPLGMYSRRAEIPLSSDIETVENTWSMLGTNISVKKGDNKWGYDEKRLITMDRVDFNKLGLGIDDLIEGFMQTVFATIAIDKMSERFINYTGGFKRNLYRTFNPDNKLVDEIIRREKLKK